MIRNDLIEYRIVLCILALICLNTAVWSAPDCTVFVTSYMQRCSATTLPSEGRALNTLNIFASPGEYEPCTFSVRANEDLRGISVEVSDLKGEKGIIPKANIVVRKAEISTRGTTNPEKVIAVECYLPKFTSIDIPKDTTQRFWLTVHVPESAKPGKYTATITLKIEGKAFKTLKLKLDVLPIKLLPPKDIAYFMYYGVHFAPKFTRNLVYHRMAALDMKAHGMNSATAYMWAGAQPDGHVELVENHNPNALSPVPQIELLKDTGLVTPGIPIIWIGSAESGNLQVYEAMYTEAKKRNWPEILLYVVDEPVTEKQQEQVIAIMAKVDEFKKSHPDIKVRTTTAINAVTIDKVGKYYDIWIVYASDVTETMVEQAKRMGKELWSYDCALAPVDAQTSRFSFGFWAWKAGLKGVSNWTYADVPKIYDGGAWDPSDKEGVGVLSFVWPTPKEPIPSISWEAIREGVDDYRYLTTLKDAIENAKAAGKTELAGEAERVLNDVESRVHVNSFTKSYIAACKGKDNQENQAYIYNRPPPEPDMPLGYDGLRSRIAQEIIKLGK